MTSITTLPNATIVETEIKTDISFIVYSELKSINGINQIVKRCQEIEQGYLNQYGEYARVIIVDSILKIQIRLSSPDEIINYNGEYDHIKTKSIDLRRINTKEEFFASSIPYLTFKH